MRSDWKGGYSMYVAEENPLRQHLDFAELALVEGYYSNLRGSIVVRKDDLERLGLKERVEIALGVSGSEPSHQRDPLAAYFEATVIGLSTQKAKNIWANFAEGAEYIDYVNAAVKFEAVDARGNLLFRKDTSDGMGLDIGDMLFLSIRRVKKTSEADSDA
jgi:hypothetical protein